MPISDHTPRLNFLKDSACMLDSLSLSTASHLLMVHNRILHDEFKPLTQRQLDFACGACGSIRKPERTKTIEIRKRKAKSSSSSASKKASALGATVYKCLRCHRRTVKPAARPNITSKPDTTAAPVSTTQSTTSTTAKSVSPAAQSGEADRSSKTADNASSKKRAKARKQGGLQALLASKQQSQSKSSQSLDLFDFLQQ
ncbi:ribonuclease P Rpr2/Rpp21/SNM1 subunit [Aspergillus novofumigatus IBT 16806]|uniref:Cullin binding protein CanA n=1 Tax=Aspergillus novofumigatus (strain IBT 16806) TaxID=1392255 RepID=A0A2I1CCF5_ASPN1|nr:uncharacterized protein P174DRAFT_439928 [Aspergillus novofumigatus IBT 16806]PKX95307.1 hypothetical protein P174DRAFT_439928 [Aspergillus novofumigatus IBT 16806]